MLDEFLQSASLRQLRMLEKMAGGIKEELVTDPQLIKELEENETKLENATEIVKPPTEH